MSNISVLRSDFDSTNWKRAFADSLLQLRPDMNPDAADEISDEEFIRSKGIDPVIAALRWVDRQFPIPGEDASARNG